MRLDAVAESLAERFALAAALVPTPVLHTHIGLLLARAVLVGTKLGIFEALADGPLEAADVARRCGSHPVATRKLLDSLASSRYLRLDRERYALAPVARRWLIARSGRSVRDKLLFTFFEAELIDRLEVYVRSGVPADLHGRAQAPETWQLYQRAMRSLAAVAAPEVVRRTPVPPGARDLLDVGGAHGHYAAALCRRHAGLRAVVLDLPPAVSAAAPLLAAEGMRGRVTHRTGDVLSADVGVACWDIILISQLAHHFDEETNRRLVGRLARALRPRGVLVLQEFVRRDPPAEQVGGLLDLYFSLTSRAGTWTFDEMAAWQRDAGLLPRRPVRLRAIPGAGQQAAVNPG